MFLKKIIENIADAGRELLEKNFSYKKKDIIELCDDLISFKGAASGIAIAREITEIYNLFDSNKKLDFFKQLNKKFSPSLIKVEERIENYLKKKDQKSLNELGEVIEGNRQEFIRRLNMAPNGT